MISSATATTIVVGLLSSAPFVQRSTPECGVADGELDLPSAPLAPNGGPNLVGVHFEVNESDDRTVVSLFAQWDGDGATLLGVDLSGEGHHLKRLDGTCLEHADPLNGAWDPSVSGGEDEDSFVTIGAFGAPGENTWLVPTPHWTEPPFTATGALAGVAWALDPTQEMHGRSTNELEVDHLVLFARIVCPHAPCTLQHSSEGCVDTLPVADLSVRGVLTWRDAEGVVHGSFVEATTGLIDSEEAVLGADFNCDGVVDGADLAAVLNAWGTAGFHDRMDLDADLAVNVTDLLLLLEQWGPGCCIDQ